MCQSMWKAISLNLQLRLQTNAVLFQMFRLDSIADAEMGGRRTMRKDAPKLGHRLTVHYCA